MSAVIRLLETLATGAYRPPLSDAQLEAAASRLEIESDQKNALLSRDHPALSALLGGRTRMFFGLATPQRDAPMREEEEEPAPEEEPTPEQGS